MIFRCMACKLPLFSPKPICPECKSSLVEFPEDFSEYFQASPDSAIQSYSACYLLIGPGYQVLKTWKSRPGLLFNRVILKDSFLQKLADKKIDAIVPIPHSVKRAWQLGGCPGERLARWIHQNTKISVRRLLTARRRTFGLTNPDVPAKRQAELSFHERLENRLRFKIVRQPAPRASAHPPLKSILLVDDFTTTGHTLRSAALLLRSHTPIAEIHAFTLGARPKLTSK